jgi:hypothetical protein
MTTLIIMFLGWSAALVVAGIYIGRLTASQRDVLPQPPTIDSDGRPV